jgi:hypothetical protein
VNPAARTAAGPAGSVKFGLLVVNKCVVWFVELVDDDSKKCKTVGKAGGARFASCIRVALERCQRIYGGFERLMQQAAKFLVY